MPNSGRFSQEGQQPQETDPLMPQQGFANPYLDQQTLQAAMEGEQGDHVSVVSDGEIANSQERILAKGEAGAAVPVAEAVASTPAVIEKKQEDEETQAWYLAPMVVFLYLFFDVGKLLMEKLATHNNSINVGCLTNVIQFANLVVAFCLCLGLIGVKEGIAQMFNPKSLMGYCAPAAFFASGQLFNLLQNLYLDAGTRKVFAQLRIPLTAVFSRFIMSQGYTTLQWIIIANIVVSVVVFQMMASSEPDAFGGKSIVLGFVFSVLANVTACLGSLVGEKAMKANKKLPFYLQKFQFELWTLAFGIVSTLVVSPLCGFIISVVNGEEGDIVDRPAFIKNWIGTYSTVHYTHSTSALTNLSFAAKYTILDASGNAVEKSVPMHNKFDLSGWSSKSDARRHNALMSQSVVAADTAAAPAFSYEDFKYGKTVDILEKYQALQKRRYADMSKVKNVDLSELGDRVALANPQDNPKKGRFYALDADQWRKWGDVLVDTSFYMKVPFDREMAKNNANGLRNSFVLQFGEQKTAELTFGDTTEQVEQFVPLNFVARQTPLSSAVVLSRGAFGEYVSKKDANKGADGEEYWQLKMDLDHAEVDLMLGATVYPKSADETALKRTYFDKASLIDGSQRMLKAVKMGKTLTYTRRVRYNPDLKMLFVAYARKTVKTMQVEEDPTADPDSTVTLESSKTQTMELEFENCGELDFSEGELESKSKDCTFKTRVYSASTAEKQTCSKNDKDTKDAKEKGKKDKAEADADAQKAAVDAYKQLTDDPAKLAFLRGHYNTEKYLEQNARPSDATHLLSVGDDVTHNRMEMFEYSAEQMESKLQGGFTLKAWSYPGKVAGGVVSKDGKTYVCNVKMCSLTNGQWESNFKFMGNIGGFKKHHDRATEKPSSEQLLNPFSFAEVHAYSQWPLPSTFCLTLDFFAAVFMNGAQSWMSLYISKVLSSLWKNICAAVALALVVILERILLYSPQKQKTTDWARLMLGTLGVLAAVFSFQNAPKAPKKVEEPKPDIENQAAAKH